MFYQPSVVKSNKINHLPTLYRKTFNQSLINALPLDPLVLAVWYLDDGQRTQNAFSGKLATQGFFAKNLLKLFANLFKSI